jgi:hypothetical protein
MPGNQLMIRRLQPIMLQIVCGLMSFILSYFTLFLGNTEELGYLYEYLAQDIPFLISEG